MAALTELHSESDLRRLRIERSALTANLISSGLRMPGADIAFSAASFAGATPADAWEAARRHELMSIGFPDEIEASGGLSYPRGLSDVAASQKRRQELIDTCRALPNPFSENSVAILRGNADLERAA
ncbi:hypothetical protein RZA67_09900 [Stenotrophomonas sp. C3(2023)]|uniref:hypothetical protein n=1 Tax=Stenotrophomonas sp. C3(2023) TaxID=3080277 RepID=UPI00293CFA7D|nr:hypothetical protein [Stenotrophomonas sp. C3(2023)]MDV3469042.1 hypothetical protein [Stenotrophomonas sp. C3(2023)]